jgi:hypothetical protein
MPGSPLKRQRKAGAVDPVTGERVPFPRLTHPRAGLSHVEWRALSPDGKIERLLGMSIGRAAEIMSRPLAECDPARLAVNMQVWRVVFMIGTKALFDGKLGRDAALERDRESIPDELLRDLESHRQPDGAVADP